MTPENDPPKNPYDDFLKKLPHVSDQMNTGMEAFAGICASYYNELIKQGIPAQAAENMTSAIITSILAPRKPS